MGPVTRPPALLGGQPWTYSARVSSEPLVSIIIPTYNRLVYLREAIRSVFDQTYANWELLVVDDGSTDGTAGYLRGLADPRVRIVEIAHTGNPARVRNAGIAAARGELVAFLDSDDVWLPEKLAVQVRGFEQEPDCAWRFCGYARIDARGAPAQLPETAWKLGRGWILEPLLRIDIMIPTPAVIVTRKLLEDAGRFDETLPYVQDYDLWFRLATKSAVGLDEQPLAQVRVMPETHTRDRMPVLQCWIRVYGKAADSLGGRLAALCRERQLRHAVVLARAHAAGGSVAAALRTLRSVSRHGRRRFRWWVAACAVLIRPLVPDALVRFRRARRLKLTPGRAGES